MQTTLKSHLIGSIVGLGLLGVVGTANAQLIVTLDPLSSQAIQGMTTTIRYNATFTNQYGYDLYLNGGFGSVDSPLSLDTNAYDNFFVFPTDANGDLLPQPAIPGNNGTLTQEIFTVTAPTSIALGNYSGVFSFQGGAGTDFNDPLNMTDLGSIAFTVRGVTPQEAVPEPGTIAWLLCFGTGMVCLTRSRSRSSHCRS
jgi:hypothetical protein